MKAERIVGGIPCRQVLADLSAYVDGELTPSQRAMLEDHVRGCDLCTQFGGVFAAAIGAVRARLRADDPAVPQGVADRLAEALRRARG